MGGGGSDTQTTSSTKAEFPPEFRPLAEGAVEQILALQGQLPLSQFAEFAPQPTAGVSPFQQAALNFLPGLLQPSAGLNTLNALTAPVGQAAGQAFGAGQRTAGAQGALDALVASGRVPAGTAAPPIPAFTLQQFLASLPGAQQLPSVIPGADPQALAAQLGAPIPPQTPILTGSAQGVPSPAQAVTPQARSTASARFPGSFFNPVISQLPV